MRLLLGLALLLFLLSLLIQLPPVQTRLTQLAMESLSERTGTETSIGRLGIRVPGVIRADRLFIGDHRGDTLVYAGKVRASINLPALLRNQVKVRSLRLDEGVANITRLQPDSLFNYDFLLKALVGNASQDKAQQPSSATSQQARPATGKQPPPATPGSGLSLEVGKISLNNIRLRYADHHDGLDLHFTFSGFSASVPFVASDFSGFHFGRTRLSGAVLHLDLSEPSVRVEREEPSRATLPDLDLRMERLEIGLLSASVTGAGDPFTVSDLSLEASGFFMSEDTLSVAISHLGGEVPGLAKLNRFSALLAMGRESFGAERLLVETPESSLEASLWLGMDLLNPDFSNPGPVRVRLDLQRILLGEDVVGLAEAFGIPFPEDSPDPVDILPMKAGMRLAGQVSDLDIQDLFLNVPGVLHLKAGGQISGLPDADRAVFDLPELSINTGRTLLGLPMLAGYVPSGLQLPDTLAAVASLKGSLTDMEGRLRMESDLGSVTLDASYRELPGRLPGYRVRADVAGIEAGTMLAMPGTIGRVTARLEAEGTGVQPENAEAVFSIFIDEAEVNGYAYRGIDIQGTYGDQQLIAALDYHDDNLQLSARNELSLQAGLSAFSGIWEVGHLDTRALNLLADTMLLQTRLAFDMEQVHPGFPVGSVRFDQSRLRAHQRSFSLDSLVLVASSPVDNGTGERQFLVDVRSRILQAGYSGNVSPLDLPGVLSAHLNTYLDQQETMPASSAETEYPVFDFSIHVIPSSWYTEVFFPGLESFDALSVSGGFRGETSVLSLEASIPALAYEGMQFRELGLEAVTEPGRLDFLLGIAGFEGFGLQLSGFFLDGQLEEEVLQFSLGFDDALQQAWLRLDGQAQGQDSLFRFSLRPDLLLNGEQWIIGGGNMVVVGPETLVVDGLQISREMSLLRAQSREVSIPGVPPLDLEFRDFELANFFPSHETPTASGILNGQVALMDILTKLFFTSDLRIDQLAYQGDILGDIEMQVSSEDLSLFRFQASVQGYGNQFELSGFYEMGDADRFELDLALASLDLSSLEGLTFGELSDMQGTASGQLSAWGSPTNPEFSGSLRFDETAFRVNMLNVAYQMNGQYIRFDRSALRFDDFSITDPAGRRLRLNGSIELGQLPDMGFSLTLGSANFLAMDVPAGQNPQYSGRALISSDLRLRGSLSAPVLDGSFALNEGSFFQVAVPQSDPRAVGAEGVVAFIAPGDSLQWPPESGLPSHDPLMSALRNLDMSINVEVDPNTDLRILVDEFAGDFLQVKGGGLLSYGTDPGGRISLAGRYELTEGTYLLTFYDFIRRQFSIRRGSSIQWTGDPLNPLVDITAVYNIRTSVRELFEHQPGGTDDPRLRQQFPFEVLLKMQGNMLSPDIDFEIVLPPEHRQALDGRLQTRLNELNQDESERNKQVFALLMLESFIQDNPFASAREGGGMEAAARTSASRLLSQQLNRLSDRYIRGVDIQFDIQSHEDFLDDGTGGSTLLNLELSRNFFDERLRVTVGGNIELEDESRRDASAGDIAGDFVIEYMLNPDGSLIIKGFRKKEFGDLFEGQVIETGVALQFLRSYNQFRELFMKREESPDIPEPF